MSFFGGSISTAKHAARLLSLLLLFASLHSVLRTHGRALLEPQAVAKGQGEEGGGDGGGDGGGGVAAAMIGSRPPRCEGRCLSCGQCEAVQVPAIPQERTPAKHFSAAAVSFGGDDSNSIYKPLSWKCKCGGMILNP